MACNLQQCTLKLKISISHGVVILASEPDAMLIAEVKSGIHGNKVFNCNRTVNRL